MKFGAIKFVLFPFLLCMKLSNGVVILRPKNLRGPGAWHSGVACLQRVHLSFFMNATRMQNAIVFHSANLSSPASEIEINYLQKLNLLISGGGLMSRLRVVSDHSPIDRLLKVPLNLIASEQFYILVIDDYQKFLFIMSSIVSKTSSWNPAARFIILFNHVDQSVINHFSVGDLFRDLYVMFHVSDIVLLKVTTGTKYDVFVSELYQQNIDTKNCSYMSFVKIDTCDNGKMKNYNKFTAMTQGSKVPRDLQYCNFTACVQIEEPFVNPGCNSGMEVLLIKIIASVLNFHLDFLCTSLPRGDILEDGSITNLLLKLRNDECDFIIGSIYPDNDIHMKFKSSTNYFEDSYTWFVPLAPYRAPWKGLVVIFTTYTWLFLVFILVVSSLAWKLLAKNRGELKKFTKFTMCILSNWSMMMGVSVSRQPLKTPLRILFMAIALYGINLSTIYTSQLIAMFTEPAHDTQIETVENILELGLPLGGREEYDDWFTNDDALDKKILEKYNRSDFFLPTDRNLERVKEGLQAMIVSRLYVLSRKYNNLVYGFKSNVFSNPYEILCEKGFPLLSSFDEVINRLKNSGIMAKIYDDELYEMNRKSKVKEDNQDIILTINHLQGAFALLGYGLMISIICFLVEVGLNKKYSWITKRVGLPRGYILTVKLLKIEDK